jgi:photosystem II stability/assembly factor-like uncharacterized protein
VPRRLVFAAAVLLGFVAGCGSPPQPPPPSSSPLPSTSGQLAPSEDAAPAPTAPIRFAGFVTASVGWAMTERAFWVTRDGGESWSAVGPAIDYAGFAPKGAAFLDADHGWIVSEDAFSSVLSLWRTADGGRTCSRLALPAVPMRPETMGQATIDPIDPDHAIIDVGGGMANGYLDALLRTADGGSTWKVAAMRPADPSVEGITGVPVFTDAKTGWLAGGAPGSRLWATRDGGDTWRLQALPFPAGFREDEGMYDGAPRFFGRSDGFVVRRFDNGATAEIVVYRTTDSGATWQSTALAVPPASSLSFITADDWVAWTMAGQGWWQSDDQGRTWSEPHPAVGFQGDAPPTFVDPDHAWGLASADPTAILLTRDGGAMWTRSVPGG